MDNNPNIKGIEKSLFTTAAQPMTALIALATSYTLYTVPAGRIAKIRKIVWYATGCGAGLLQIGYDTLALAFIQCLPNIVVLNNMDGYLNKDDIPVCGNTPEGFRVDATLVTGNGGLITARTTCALVAVATPLTVKIEVEEYGV